VFERLKSVGGRIREELGYYRLVLAHPRTPRASKALLWLALGYVLMPFDIIPDFIPVIGHLDDLVVVPALILLAMRLVPEHVRHECRERSRRRDGEHDAPE